MVVEKKVKLVITGLYIGKGSFGGVTNFNKLLIKNLNKNIFEVFYYSLGRSPRWCKLEKKVTKYEYYLELIINVAKFYFFLIKNRIDLVHINTGLSQFNIFRDGILSLLAKLARKETIFIIHGWKVKDFNIIQKNNIKKNTLLNCLNHRIKLAYAVINLKTK